MLRKLLDSLQLVASIGVACFCLFSSPTLHAQDAKQATTPPKEAADSVQALTEKLAAVDQDATLDDANKAAIKAIYQQAIEARKTAEQLAEQLTDFERQIKSAESDIQAANESLGQDPAVRTLPENLTNASLDVLSQQLETLESTLKEKEELLSKLAAEPSRRATRLAELPNEIRAIGEEIQRLTLESVKEPDQGDPLAVANQALALATLQREQNKLAKDAKEQELYGSTVDVVRSQHDKAARDVEVVSKQAVKFREVVNRLRQLEASKQTREAEEELRKTVPEVKSIAEQNATLAKHLEDIVNKVSTTGSQLQQVQVAADDLRKQYDRVRLEVEDVGLTEANGRLLREQRTQLPDVAQSARNIRGRKPEFRNIRFEIYTYQYQWSDLAKMEEAVESELRQLGQSPTPQLQQAVKRLLEQRRELLAKLVDNYQNCAQLFLKLDVAEQQLIDTTGQFQSLIDSRVLWIPSAAPISSNDITPAFDGAKWLVNAENWKSFGRDVISDVRLHPIAWFALFVAMLYGIRQQQNLRHEITKLGLETKRRQPTHITPMMRTVVCTIVVSLLWPLLALFVSWQIHRSLEATDFSRAIAAGLQSAVTLFFPLELIRQVCRPDGLADAHFQWPIATLTNLRRWLRGLITWSVPMWFLVEVFQHQSKERLWHASFGRAIFLMLMSVVAISLFLLLRPKTGVFAAMLNSQSEGWKRRSLRLVVLWVMLAPVMLAVTAAAGYFETAAILTRMTGKTLFLIAGVLFVIQGFEHWLLINRRRLIRQQRKMQAEVRLRESDAETVAPEALQLEEELVDVSELSEQTRRTIQMLAVIVVAVGAWLIWRQVLPALHLLDSISLPGTSTITAGMLVSASLILVATTIAARNVPGLFEFLLLRHFPLDSGSRYAVTTLIQYVIVASGIVFAGQALSISWSSLQWLVAAMGIGLGFGLQEIFANFISGIILLFERPLRVGDIVTVDDKIGTVTRIRMRATTITDFDRKEYVVPNKDLVTGRFLNWTLSNAIQRIAVPVGVAYGSDTALARSLMLEVARQNARVLKEPQPYATFEQFGDSSLSLVLRCYLQDVDMKLGVITELNTAIDAAFKQAHIEIAFPQRDLHIRSIDGELRTSVTGQDAGQDDQP